MECIEKVATSAQAEDSEGGDDNEECHMAQLELDDMRTSTEAAVQAALAGGRSVKRVEGGWAHEALTVVALQAAVDEVESFPRVSPTGRKLAKEGKLVLQVGSK